MTRAQRQLYRIALKNLRDTLTEYGCQATS